MKQLLTILAFLTLNAQADQVNPSKEVLSVIYQAARQHDVDAQDLIRVAFVESRFKTYAKRVNSNNTIDYGMFQINSVHWTTTCKAFDVFTLEGNANCAATILSKLKKRHGAKDKNWIGRYHSRTPAKKKLYAKLLSKLNLNVGIN